MSTVIDNAVAYMLAIANDDTHGYDQNNRWSPDFDCSSLLITAWQYAGVPVKDAGATYTGNIYEVFTQQGFSDVTSSVDWVTGKGLRKGDILLIPSNHVAMMYSPTHLVHAKYNEFGEITGGQTGDQTGNEITTEIYYNKPWTYCLRHNSSTASDGNTIVVSKSDVTGSNAYLTQEQMQKNASYICAFFLAKGWSLNAICGILGNMQEESTINPNVWEGLIEGRLERGYGLAQWTPASDYINRCNSLGWDYTDIDTQLNYMIYEYDNNLNWWTTDETYTDTKAEFIVSTKTPEYLAYWFLNNYERPSNREQPQRQTYARYWYDYFLTNYPELDSGSSGSKRKYRKMKLLLMTATRRRNKWRNRSF